MATDLEMFQRLTKAVDKDEIQLHFQPVVDSEHRHLAGFEALVRWYDPKSNEMVSPGQFLPFAEESGLILLLGEKILDDACRQAKLWNMLGRHTRTVSVNIAAKQLRDDSFPDVVFKAIKNHDLKPDALRLEFPQAALSTSQHVLDKLNTLKDAGIKLALDDFGRGISSINLLRQYPFDLIKYERGFLLEIEQDDASRVIAKGVADMAHELGMAISVVGIETEDQAAIAKQFGADYLQGYLFGRPAAADDVQTKSA